MAFLCTSSSTCDGPIPCTCLSTCAEGFFVHAFQHVVLHWCATLSMCNFSTCDVASVHTGCNCSVNANMIYGLLSHVCIDVVSETQLLLCVTHTYNLPRGKSKVRTVSDCIFVTVFSTMYGSRYCVFYPQYSG